jgi:hypothetical protein
VANSEVDEADRRDPTDLTAARPPPGIDSSARSERIGVRWHAGYRTGLSAAARSNAGRSQCRERERERAELRRPQSRRLAGVSFPPLAGHVGYAAGLALG